MCQETTERETPYGSVSHAVRGFPLLDGVFFDAVAT